MKPTLSEKLLLRLSTQPKAIESYSDPLDPVTALKTFRAEFPDFDELIRGKKVVDFGCGFGFQATAIALAGAQSVLGLEMEPEKVEFATEQARKAGLASKVRFQTKINLSDYGQFDVILSQDAMEHFSQPKEVLEEMTRLLKPGGLLLMTFGPPWYAPYGAHMQYFVKVPWVHLLFSEKTIMKVRSRFRNDNATRYSEVPGGLNQMTLSRFERLVAHSGLKIRSNRYRCVRKMSWSAKLPGVRELMVNNVSVKLTKTT